ncbi:lipopolysaccharide biosynthesis protein RfbH [Lachnospiraceae bacterium 45-W7]
MNQRWRNEQEARQDILDLVADYYHTYKEENHPYEPGGKIPYSGRVYDEKEMCRLTEAALDFWLTSGRFVREFEAQFSKWLGVSYTSLVNSGSSANLVAFAALTAPELGERAIKPEDEVITVAAAFPTTVNPIIQYGAIPVFLDVTIPQYNIDVQMLEKAYSPKTKAVFLAHTLGNPFDLDAVKSFCDRHNLWLIEDTCDALGGTYTYHGEECMVGTIGDIGTSSFYPPHHMTMGEGGCVYTNNPQLHRLIRSFRDWGRDCMCESGQDDMCGHRFDGTYGELPQGYDHKFVYSHFGYNLKITDLQAAIGCEQLKKLPGFVKTRRHNWKRLREGLACVSDQIILPEAQPCSNPSWFGFLITVRKGIDCIEVVKYIERKGIQTRRLFAGNLIKHPCFDEMRCRNEGYRIVGNLKNTDRIMKDSFWVGVYPGMDDARIDYMIAVIKQALQNQK